MRQKIKTVLKEQIFDIVQVEHSFMASYVDIIPPEATCKKAITIHNVGELLFRRMFWVENRLLQKIEYLLDWILSWRWEHKVCKKFDQCFTISKFDENVLHRRDPGLHISTIPNGIDPDFHRPFPMDHDSNDILLVGNLSYAPNRDAAFYFIKTIFPLIQNKIETARLAIVGDNPSQKLFDLAVSQGVRVTGYVPNILPYFKNCALLAVPLRAGSGVRGKILESMALGRPVVSTSLGCEGIDVVHGKTIMIGDTPEDFAACVAQLLKDKKLRQEIAENARKMVEGFHNWDRSAEIMMEAYEKMVGSL